MKIGKSRLVSNNFHGTLLLETYCLLSSFWFHKDSEYFIIILYVIWSVNVMNFILIDKEWIKELGKHVLVFIWSLQQFQSIYVIYILNHSCFAIKIAHNNFTCNLLTGYGIYNSFSSFRPTEKFKGGNIYLFVWLVFSNKFW